VIDPPMNGPHHPLREPRSPEPGPAGTFWRPRLTLARGMTIVAVSACVFWAARQLTRGNFIASFLVVEAIWIYLLLRLIRGKSKDGRIF